MINAELAREISSVINSVEKDSTLESFLLEHHSFTRVATELSATEDLSANRRVLSKLMGNGAWRNMNSSINEAYQAAGGETSELVSINKIHFTSTLLRAAGQVLERIEQGASIETELKVKDIAEIEPITEVEEVLDEPSQSNESTKGEEPRSNKASEFSEVIASEVVLNEKQINGYNIEVREVVRKQVDESGKERSSRQYWEVTVPVIRSDDGTLDKITHGAKNLYTFGFGGNHGAIDLHIDQVPSRSYNLTTVADGSDYKVTISIAKPKNRTQIVNGKTIVRRVRVDEVMKIRPV